jgi:hypothetical protein
LTKNEKFILKEALIRDENIVPVADGIFFNLIKTK